MLLFFEVSGSVLPKNSCQGLTVAEEFEAGPGTGVFFQIDFHTAETKVLLMPARTVAMNIYNEKTFYYQFIQDLKSSRSRVLIQSPFLKTNRINKVFSALKDCTSRGVRICVFAQRLYKPSPEDIAELALCSERLRSLNVHLNMIKLIHEKIAIIDENITWEGSLNILSQNVSKERMTRWEGKRFAYKTIEMHNLNSCKECSFLSPDLELIGALVCRRRKDLGLTQKELSEKAEISISALSHLELGKKSIRVSNLLRLFKELQLGISCLPEAELQALYAHRMAKQFTGNN